MVDEAAPASARIRAAIEILDRGYGRPPRSREVLTPFSQRPHFPTQEAIDAELRRRGLLSVRELVAQEMEREDSNFCEAEDPASFAQQGSAAPPLTKTPPISAPQDDRYAAKHSPKGTRSTVDHSDRCISAVRETIKRTLKDLLPTGAATFEELLAALAKVIEDIKRRTVP
jgi:hypothetical protein